MVEESFNSLQKRKDYLDERITYVKSLIMEEGRHRETAQILKNQTFFTELMALATLILALSSVLTLLNFKFVTENNTLIWILSIFSGGLFLICVIVLIIKSVIYLLPKDKNDNR